MEALINGTKLVGISVIKANRGTLYTFSAIFDKGDNFYDLLFALLYTYPFLTSEEGICSNRKEFAPKESKFFPFRIDPIQKGDKTT